MTRPAEEARRRARDIRDEALSRLAERDRISLDLLRSEMSEIKVMLREQGEQIAALKALVASLAPDSGLPADAPAPSTPRPLSSHKRVLLERIRDLRAQGLSFSRICEIFQAEGVSTLSGEGQWSKGTLWNLWRNHHHQLRESDGA
jgi:hypothetical protein